MRTDQYKLTKASLKRAKKKEVYMTFTLPHALETLRELIGSGIPFSKEQEIVIINNLWPEGDKIPRKLSRKYRSLIEQRIFKLQDILD